MGAGFLLPTFPVKEFAMDTKTVKVLCQGLMGQGNVIPVNVMLLKGLDGDYPASVMMAQLIYWSSRTTHPDELIYKTHVDWNKELYLSRKASTRATGVVKDAGLIDTIVKRAPNGTPSMHYKILWANLSKFLDCTQREQSIVPEGNNPLCPKDTIIINTETTPENTAKREEAPSQKNEIGGEVPTHHSPSQTPASTKGYLGEASVGVVAGKSTAETTVEVINYLNQQTGSSHVPGNSEKEIGNCLKNGLSVADLKRIIDNVKHWTEDDKNRVFLRPSHLFGKNASELLALPPRKGASVKHSSTSKRQYYLTDPNGNPDAVLVDESSIPVGTDAWDKEGRRIIL
jgi:uncharacterized phage protein (TIGR02220 family)